MEKGRRDMEKEKKKGPVGQSSVPPHNRAPCFSILPPHPLTPAHL